MSEFGGNDRDYGFKKKISKTTLADLGSAQSAGVGSERLIGANLLKSKNNEWAMGQSPSSKYVACILGNQPAGTGAAKDISGNSNDVMFSNLATDATVWGTTGYFASAAGAGLGPFLMDAQSTNFDMLTTSFLMMMTMNAAVPASAVSMFGNGTSTTNRGLGGFVLNSSGKLKPYIFTANESLQAAVSSSVAVATGADVSFALAWDHVSRRLSLFYKGALTDQWYMPITGTTISANPRCFTFGASGDTGLGAQTSVAAMFKNFHLMTFTDSLPLNIGGIAAKYMELPTKPISVDELITPRKKVNLMIGPAQSNECGSGETPDRSSYFGVPHMDAVYPSGSPTKMSMWPTIASEAAKGATYINVWDSAIGSSGSVNMWCGYARNWTNNMVVGTGSYVINAGNVYKMTTFGASIYSPSIGNSTVAPTHTSGTATGVDSWAWQFVRTVTAEDIDGHVYDKSSALFDPNGYFANALAGYNSRCDENWALISIGQTDVTFGVTQTQYKAALTNAIDYWKSKRVKVLLGFTCYSASQVAMYDSTLIPAYNAVVADYASDPMVKKGVNNYVDIGVLPIATVARSPVPSVMNYGLSTAYTYGSIHMNNAALRKSAFAWAVKMRGFDII